MKKKNSSSKIFVCVHDNIDDLAPDTHVSFTKRCNFVLEGYYGHQFVMKVLQISTLLTGTWAFFQANSKVVNRQTSFSTSNMSYMNHCPSINFRLYFFMSSFAEDHRDDNISVWMKCWYLRLEIHTIIMTYDLSKNDDHNDRLDNNTKIFMFSMFFFRFCFHCPFDCSAESVQRCVWSFFSIALKSCCLSVEKIYSIVITINFV